MNFLDMFWRDNTENHIPKPFSIYHIISLLIILFIILLIYKFKDAIHDSVYKEICSYIIGFTLILHQISIYIWYITNNRFNLKESLPLYLCRISIILCIIMIFTKSHKIFDIVYFWGLGGATIALIFHDTSLYPFPHYIFIQFFISHGFILIATFFMMFVYRYTPNLNSLIRTLNWTLIYFSLTIPINYLVDGNYCYLRYRPCATPLDYLPDSPIFFASFIIIGICILFLILYLPFRRKVSF